MELRTQLPNWNKHDDRLMKAVERDEVEKVAAVLSKKGINPTKLDGEGRFIWQPREDSWTVSVSC
uniref:Uncharacterized protein n=1 Tax=Fundulus heteroclitus TaxID=8078 RepID=A0A3Q2PS95_FUNHE